MLQLLAAAWAAFIGPLAFLLMLIAATWDGRMFAVAALSWAALPFIAFSSHPLANVRRKRGKVGVLTVAILLTVPLVLRAPPIRASSAANVQRIPMKQVGVLDRLSFGNLLPEVDQLMLGFTLATVVDRLFTRSQCSELKTATREIYGELDSDADFRAVGSLMPEAYRGMLSRHAQVGESFLYVPGKVDRTQPLPVIVFLHGSGGNLKGYLWVLARVADQIGALIVAPSAGMGRWMPGEAATVIDHALASLPAGLRIDTTNVHLVGLSNGGRGVTQLLQTRPDRFRSIVFVSPVFDEQVLSGIAFESEDSCPTVLVLTGSLDDRVPLTYVDASAKRLRAGNVRVSFRTIEGADHFAMFSHRAEITQALGSWFLERMAQP